MFTLPSRDSRKNHLPTSFEMSSDTKFYGLSEKDNWRTPPKLLNAIREHHGGIDTDPCSGPLTWIGDYFNFDADDNGLVQMWIGTCFVNPPFSFKAKFLEKATSEMCRAHCDTIFFVTPDATDTKSWWHEYIAKHSNYIWFSRGRISYIGEDGKKAKSPTFGTAVSVFGETTDEMLAWFSDNGHLVKTVKT